MRAETAVSMLNCRSNSWSVGTGGIAHLTPQDVASALAGCRSGPYWLGLYKYTEDRSALKPLMQCIVSGIGPLVDSHTHDQDTLHRLARVLVADSLSEHRHSVCNGTGVYQYRICKGCGGTGNKPINNNEMARELKVSHYIWAKRWKRLYDVGELMIQEWQQYIIDHINRRLGA